MLNISTKKLVRLQFQLPHDLKTRCDQLIKYHKDHDIQISVDLLVEYLLGRMLDESPDLADFRTYEATEASKPKQEGPKAAEAADGATTAAPVVSASESAPTPPSSSRPARVAAPNPDASEIAKREMERRAASGQSNVNTPAE